MLITPESELAFASDAGGDSVSTEAMKDGTDAFADLRHGDRRGPFFSPPGFRHQEPRGDE